MHIYIFSACLQGTSNSYQQNASITACFIKKVGTFQLQRGPVNFNFIFVRLNCFFSLTKASTNEQIPIPSPPQSLFTVFFRETRPPDHRIPTHPLSILYWPGAKLPFCLRSPVRDFDWRELELELSACHFGYVSVYGHAVYHVSVSVSMYGYV